MSVVQRLVFAVVLVVFSISWFLPHASFLLYLCIARRHARMERHWYLSTEWMGTWSCNRRYAPIRCKCLSRPNAAVFSFSMSHMFKPIIISSSTPRRITNALTLDLRGRKPQESNRRPRWRRCQLLWTPLLDRNLRNHHLPVWHRRLHRQPQSR